VALTTAAIVTAWSWNAHAAPQGDPSTYTLTKVNKDGSASCFKHNGSFRKGSYVMSVKWSGTQTDECFGVAPDNSIWHIWAKAGKWVEMPHNGRAKNPVWAATNVKPTIDGYNRSVFVRAPDGVSCWYSTNYDSQWGGWEKATGVLLTLCNAGDL
jgi:hypothetical protein